MAEIKEEQIENKGENQKCIEKTNNPMTYVFINIQVNVPHNGKDKTTFSLDWVERHFRREDYLYPGGYFHCEWVSEGDRRGYYHCSAYERKYGVGIGISPPDIGIGVSRPLGEGISITPEVPRVIGVGIGHSNC
jgi:hypothetical protein